MEFNRRNFIRLSGAGLAGSLVAGNLKAATPETPQTHQNKNRKIIYRTLGRTGIKVPVVSLGAMRLDNPNLIKTALEGGIFHIDTAQSYMQGRNEEMLGNILKNYPRDSFVISTKIGLRQQLVSKDELMAKIDVSLKKLQMDYVDILYLHGMDKEDYVLDPTLIGILEEVKKSGKAKFVGFSTHRNMAAMIKAAVQGKVYDVVLTSYNFRLDNLPELNDALTEAAAAGLGTVAMKTMAGAFWDKEKQHKINTKAALKWALQNENIHTAIPGVTSFEQLEENLDVMGDIQLTDQERLDLAGDKTTTGLFCLGCEECIPQCPNNVPVPDLMRSYMYAYGYQDPRLAREVVDNLPDGSDACNLCPECNVACRNGFNIREKARDILRIKNVPSDFLV